MKSSGTYKWPGAHVISSDMCTADMSSEMSSETLERILNVTLSEPMLESKAASVESTTLSELAIQKHSDQPCQPAVTTSGNSGGSDYKKPKLNQTEQTSSVLSFSSEQDIDNFLDQIHQ